MKMKMFTMLISTILMVGMVPVYADTGGINITNNINGNNNTINQSVVINQYFANLPSTEKLQQEIPKNVNYLSDASLIFNGYEKKIGQNIETFNNYMSVYNEKNANFYSLGNDKLKITYDKDQLITRMDYITSKPSLGVRANGILKV